MTSNLKLLNPKSDINIGGTYCRSRPSTDIVKSEFQQLHQQILSAAQIGKTVILLGDLNLDYNNPEHLLTKEANDLLAVIEAANMRHMPNQIPTLKSYGLHKLCKCAILDSTNQRFQRSSYIDNAYISVDAHAGLKILDVTVTDHYSLLLKLKTSATTKAKIESV